ncbi:MAG: CRISPR-associated endonuclease Cas1, partial [Candidatus Nanopelagicaceae bacterium]
NFAYSLIDQQCLNLLLAHGFSPDIGILHTDSNLRNAPPLVRDLAIEYKFLAELVILKIVNRRQIALKDFSKKALNPTACNLIAAELEKKMKREIAYDAQGKCTYSLAMTLQMQLLRAYFLGQQEKYFPLAVK